MKEPDSKPVPKLPTTSMKNPDSFPFQTKKWLEGLSHGHFGYEIETLGLQGLKVVTAQKGLIRCTFVIPKTLADKDGNWHIGAIATLIDDLGAAAIASSHGEIKTSVTFDISYLSTAKIEDEVEIEAKVLTHRDKLTSILVEITRKDNGEMVAMGKQWMAKSTLHPINRASKL